MSKRLYLLRHAKSSWKQPELADHDRPLASRGRRAAKAIARHLRERQIAPELVLCSTARRARETLERIEPALATAAVRREPQLYRASADVLFERLRTVPDDVASVMLIGHNPGNRATRPRPPFGAKRSCRPDCGRRLLWTNGERHGRPSPHYRCRENGVSAAAVGGVHRSVSSGVGVRQLMRTMRELHEPLPQVT
jgi:phosphohistidine phosphatase SixA